MLPPAKETIVRALLRAGRIACTIPEKPQSRLQRHRPIVSQVVDSE